MRLVSWIGGNDLDAAEAKIDQSGAIAATLASASFAGLHLLYSYPEKRVTNYLSWLSLQYALPLVKRRAELASPIDFHDIYLAADALLADLAQASTDPIAVLLSPGTPAMQAVWILLGKTKYPVTFYQATLEQGVQQVDIPFEIAAEFVPKRDQQLLHLSVGQVSTSAAFNDIVTQNPLMETLKRQATVLAMRDVPALIYGETGTGKELFATAIHNASLRKDCTFVPVNGGAIPQELIDSVFFGHVKGAFSNDADSLKYRLIKSLKKLDGVFNSISLEAFSGAFQCQPIR